MKDDKGKVIISLLAGATAGIVAGLLLAPETGDETRSGLRQTAAKWGSDLSKLLKDGLAQGQAPDPAAADVTTSENKQTADRLLHSLSSAPIGPEATALTTPATSKVAAPEPGDLRTPATGSASVAGISPDRAHLTEE